MTRSPSLRRSLPALTLCLSLGLAGCVTEPRKIANPMLRTPVWTSYVSQPDFRAMAVAGELERAWVAGVASEEASREDAEREALARCKEQRRLARMVAPCELYAVGSEIVWKGNAYGYAASE